MFFNPNQSCLLILHHPKSRTLCGTIYGQFWFVWVLFWHSIIDLLNSKEEIVNLKPRASCARYKHPISNPLLTFSRKYFWEGFNITFFHCCSVCTDVLNCEILSKLIYKNGSHFLTQRLFCRFPGTISIRYKMWYRICCVVSRFQSLRDPEWELVSANIFLCMRIVLPTIHDAFY